MPPRSTKSRHTQTAKKLAATPIAALRTAAPGGKSQMQITFKVGDKAVYPAAGVGEVTAIESREISGQNQTFYILRILDNGVKIMIPTNNVRQVGLREVIGKD